MEAGGLAAALERVPRRRLGSYPTELRRLDRLGREMGRPLWIKHDDGLGPVGGGNKTRKLEYLLEDAVENGFTRVVTVGGRQSNHARLTAAAARVLGLEPHLLLFGEPPERSTGNLLIDELLGARIHFIPPGPVGDGPCTFDELDEHCRREAAERVGEHCFVPLGGSNALGSLGYVRAAVEIDAQAGEAGIENAWVVVATGSGGTLAGLVAGLWAIGSSLRPMGIDVARLLTDYPDFVARLANGALGLLGLPAGIDPREVPIIENRYVGRGYAVPTDEGSEAIRRLARAEGILLDPIYTGKAFAGLLDLHERGHFGAGEPVIFWHTGGLPGLFAR